ncbi:MAG: hypothetical protein Q8N13_11030 [Acidovorax sp.]|nr:hypothetical protein [Acidovorax sp.]
MRSADGLAGWHLVRPEGAEFTFRSCWRYSPWSKPVKKAYCRYDGYANTLTMAAARNSLAKKIRNLPGDCYLPSRAESALLYAVIPEQFRENWHWTSTQHSCEEAWGQNFTQGYQSSTHLTQDAEGWCLVVRRVPIENSAA